MKSMPHGFPWLILVPLPNLPLVGWGATSQGQNQASQVNMKLEVNSNPPSVGPRHLSLVLTDSKDQPIDRAELEVTWHMDHTGMERLRAKARVEAISGYDFQFAQRFKCSAIGNRGCQ